MLSLACPPFTSVFFSSLALIHISNHPLVSSSSCPFFYLLFPFLSPVWPFSFPLSLPTLCLQSLLNPHQSFLFLISPFPFSPLQSSLHSSFYSCFVSVPLSHHFSPFLLTVSPSLLYSTLSFSLSCYPYCYSLLFPYLTFLMTSHITATFCFCPPLPSSFFFVFSDFVSVPHLFHTLDPFACFLFASVSMCQSFFPPCYPFLTHLHVLASCHSSPFLSPVLFSSNKDSRQRKHHSLASHLYLVCNSDYRLLSPPAL